MTTQKRKRDHLDICVKQNVEVGSTWLDDVTLVHRPLPEMDFDDTDTSIEFFGKKLRLPLMIAAVTGGAAESKKINRDFAAVAERHGIGFGLGSQRAMVEDPKLRATYYVRDVAPRALVFGNIGITQLREYDTKRIDNSMRSAGVDAICVHINAAQEIFQTEGDTDFRGCAHALGMFCKESRYPVVAKEVGNGIGKESAMILKNAGVRAIDVGGYGGTSWIVVDGIRSGRDVSLFKTWGIPTAASILESRTAGLPVIATGGIRSGLDIAKVISLGASCCGIALPFLRAHGKGGKAAVEKHLEKLENELRIAMFLTGSKNIGELKNAQHVVFGDLRKWMQQRGL